MEKSNGQSNGRLHAPDHCQSNGQTGQRGRLSSCGVVPPAGQRRQDTHAHTSMLPFGAHRIAVGGSGRQRIFIVLVPPSPVRCRRTDGRFDAAEPTSGRPEHAPALPRVRAKRIWIRQLFRGFNSATTQLHIAQRAALRAETRRIPLSRNFNKRKDRGRPSL